MKLHNLLSISFLRIRLLCIKFTTYLIDKCFFKNYLKIITQTKQANEEEIYLLTSRK